MSLVNRLQIRSLILPLALASRLSFHSSFAAQKPAPDKLEIAECSLKEAGGRECTFKGKKITLTGETIFVGTKQGEKPVKIRIPGLGKTLGWTIDEGRAYIFTDKNELNIVPLNGKDIQKNIYPIENFKTSGEVVIALYGNFVFLASNEQVAKLDLRKAEIEIRKLALKNNSGFTTDDQGNLMYCGVRVCRTQELDIKQR